MNPDGDALSAEDIKQWHLNEDGTPPLLHPDLEPWLTETEFGWPFLNHPLVQHLPYTPVMAGLANAQYEARRKLAERYIEEENWRAYIGLTERPYRVQAFEAVMGDMDDATYWEVLRFVWCDSENIWQNLESWQALLSNTKRKGRAQHFMEGPERAALTAMPGRIEVWRGTNAPNYQGSGLSWTTDRARGEWFAKRFMREGQKCVLLHGEVAKSSVVAYLTDRGESEIVVAGARRVGLRDLTIYDEDGERTVTREEAATVKMLREAQQDIDDEREDQRGAVERAMHDRLREGQG